MKNKKRVYISRIISSNSKSDNLVGMYDLVNQKLYTNNGYGTFKKKNDI